MMPFSTLRPKERISVTSLRPLACRAQCTTRSMQEATVGTTKALALYVKTLRRRLQYGDASRLLRASSPRRLQTSAVSDSMTT